MQRIDCDFQARSRSTPLGWALLVIGLLWLAAAIAAQVYLSEATKIYAERIRHAQPAASASGNRAAPPPDARRDDAALAAAKRALGQLKLPWQALFGALEQADNDDIAMLSLTPDVRKGEIRIFAEARNLAAVLAYEQRLEASGQFRDVSLTDHEIVAKDPNHPVRFTMVANWGEAGARP